MILTIKIELEDATVKVSDDTLDNYLDENNVDPDELTSNQLLELGEAELEDAVNSDLDIDDLADLLGGEITDIELTNVEFSDESEIELP